MFQKGKCLPENFPLIYNSGSKNAGWFTFATAWKMKNPQIEIEKY